MDLQALVGESYARLADTLEVTEPQAWDRPSLCAEWRVRDVVAHVTMPARMSEQQFGAEMAAAHGDFQRMSDTVAARDSAAPIAEHLANLRSPTLARWQPPGGGTIGALNHAVVHGLDITNALQAPPACSPDAARAILDSLTAGGVAAHFGVDLAGTRLQATDLDWSWGDGELVAATSAELISLTCRRTLPNGRAMQVTN
jgi:uncharacterized protein (TIGR03083 family)